MNQPTTKREKIRKNIEKSIADDTAMAIVLKDIKKSAQYPKIVKCEFLTGSTLTFTGLLPPTLSRVRFTVDLEDILGCGTYSE